MDKNIFTFKHYKDYLTSLTGVKASRSGMKARIAEAIRCQPTYISQVINGEAHLSFEQSEMLCRFLQMSEEETYFFMLLVHRDRAGTTELKKFYNNQIQIILKQRMNLVHRLGEKNKLTEEKQALYYSSWQYAAIHIALTVPSLQTREALAHYFRISLKRVDVVLRHLVEMDLAIPTDKGFSVGPSIVRLDNKSPYIIHHHAHWREQAIESLEREEITDLHYSAVVSISQKDVGRIKDRILEFLKENSAIISQSPEEEVYVFSTDFFHLKK